jgi:hypothetical protein
VQSLLTKKYISCVPGRVTILARNQIGEKTCFDF